MFNINKKQIAGMAIFSTATILISFSLWAKYEKEDRGSAGVIGIHHLGNNYSIERFYLNGSDMHDVPRNGGGGATICCVTLPSKWRPGLHAEVKWAVLDWREAILSPTGRYSGVKVEGTYKAIVPVERYEVVGEVYVHFLANGKVRFVSSMYGAEHPAHPVHQNAPESENMATNGERVEEFP